MFVKVLSFKEMDLLSRIASVSTNWWIHVFISRQISFDAKERFSSLSYLHPETFCYRSCEISVAARENANTED
ncbi:hypothetical protein K7X08_018882 [Anisodus acutangulus]|uniref:Uncharacterized protein n=1 Tax=Anisodus acutangulus TaxID=402998 RepID=A0A9Q1R7M5_9SOLA|nr:hypothetical protein K7X08_018882 [Anisodus acutangulus]